MQKNPVFFWELASHNAEKTVEFLKNVFDWEVELDERLGIYEIPAGFITIYIQVDDIDTKIKLIEENGGYIVEKPPELPTGTRICLFNEPSGVTLAMLQKPK